MLAGCHLWRILNPANSKSVFKARFVSMKIGVKIRWCLLSHQTCLQKPCLRLRFRIIVTIFANTWKTKTMDLEALEGLSEGLHCGYWDLKIRSCLITRVCIKPILLPTWSKVMVTWSCDQCRSLIKRVQVTKPSLQNKELRNIQELLDLYGETCDGSFMWQFWHYR